MTDNKTYLDIPGEKSRELLARRQQFVARGVSSTMSVFAEKAEGAIIEDVDGNRYIDFAGGIGVMNIGHSRPEVVQAIAEQAAKYVHTCFSVMMYEPYVALAERIVNFTPGNFPKKAIFFNSGAAAVENPVKIARYATGKPAIVIEPVQGEGGFIPAPAGFLRALKALCERYDILFIADEIQSGFCRTGRMFAVEHDGVVPDMVLVAKSLAAGMPLSGVVGRAEIMDAPPPGTLGGTYSGNPVACAAALAVLDLLETEDYAARSREIGHIITQRFLQLQQRYPLVGDVRGLGGMAAIELVRDRATKEPDAHAASEVLAAAHHRGLVLIKAGMYDSVLRILT